MRPKGK
jgi:hypothetical protein